MDNKIKHLPRANKQTTRTKLLYCEYCIMQEDGNATATTDRQLVRRALLDGKKVFQVTTYELKIKQPLKNKE